MTLAPHAALLTYFVLLALATGPGFLFVFPPLYFRYHTLRYEFDEEGVTMRWGILFRREVSLTYARIQDIHLSSNLLERWLGLAKIQIQTASGSANAELTVQGVREFESIRDFLYSRMRGSGGSRGGEARSSESVAVPAAVLEDVVAALRETSQELRALKQRLGPGEPG